MYTRCRLARAHRPAVIISQAEAPKIEATLHPVRWALIVGLAIPILLLLSFLIAKGAGQDALANYAIRCVRYFAGLELVALCFSQHSAYYMNSGQKGATANSIARPESWWISAAIVSTWLARAKDRPWFSNMDTRAVIWIGILYSRRSPNSRASAPTIVADMDGVIPARNHACRVLWRKNSTLCCTQRARHRRIFWLGILSAD